MSIYLINAQVLLSDCTSDFTFSLTYVVVVVKTTQLPVRVIKRE